MTHDSRPDDPANGNPLSAPTPVTYQSFLLRLWRKDAGCTGPLWRAMLESVAEPSERQHFADMDELIAFLRTLGTSVPPIV